MLTKKEKKFAKLNNPFLLWQYAISEVKIIYKHTIELRMFR